MNNKIDYDNLEYTVYSKKEKFDFSNLTDPITFLDDLKKGKTSREETKNMQQNYRNYLRAMRKGKKSDEQKKALAKLNMFYNARDNATKFIQDYGSMILKQKTGKRTRRNRT